MKADLNDFKIGDLVSYWPTSEPGAHYRAIVEKIGKRITVRVLLHGVEGGRKLVTTRARIVAGQLDMLDA